jgi:hypothetical protein
MRAVMQTKLTLRLEDTLIQQAKSYAKQHDKSLSQAAADYFSRNSENRNTEVINSVSNSGG